MKNYIKIKNNLGEDMEDKNEHKKIIDELVLNYSNITKFEKKDKLNIMKGIEHLLAEYTSEEIIDAIKNLSKKTRYIPNVAEIKIEINKIKQDSRININSSLNLNSSYWYINLRMMCDKGNIPYYDITTGEELPPFKNNM